MPNNSVHKLTAEELPAALAKFIAEKQAAAIARRGKFVVALSGGSMPKVLGAALSGKHGKFKWPKWHIFYADERCVALDHADSTYLAYAALFAAAAIPSAQIYAIDPALAPSAAAQAYEAKLRAVFGAAMALPALDMALLGLGPDGHTASLFPGHALLQHECSWVASIEDSPKPPPSRITLSLPVLNASRQVCFVATGAGKAELLPKVAVPEPDAAFPAARIQPEELHWWVDEAAAAQMPGGKADL